MVDLSYLLIFSVIYVFIKYGPAKEPFERFKNWFNADKKTSKVIRCQKSIQHIRKAESAGYIEIDYELRTKLAELEIGLKSRLDEIKEEQKNPLRSIKTLNNQQKFIINSNKK